MAGPFYFAWVDVSETTYGPAYAREDEDVFSVEISHEEGDFPALSITILNPRVGFLAPERPRWAWLSWDNGSEIVPLFFGRIVGQPEDIQAESVTVTMISRPANYYEQKLIVADSLKVRPFWDPIWFNPDNRDDPDNVLESRPELWHIDRISLAVSTSHILTGEDGVLEFGENDVFYDSVHVTYGSAPLRRVDVVASVSWVQKAEGVLDFSSQTFWGAGNSILTYTPDGLIANWPKPGSGIGGGWTVGPESQLRALYGLGPYNWGYFQAVVGRGLTARPQNDDRHSIIVPEWADAYVFGVTGGGSGGVTQFPAHILDVLRARLAPVLPLQYNVSRNYGEQIMFSLEADVQAVIAEPEDDDTTLLTFSSSELTSPIDPPQDDSSDFSMPIGDLRNPAFFSTDRGALSIEYLIALARSRLLSAARTVFVEFQIPFELGVASMLSCRKSVVLTDYRLPGGSAAGKIISYTLSANGDDGTMVCTIRIGCTVGQGNTVAATDGDPTYVEDDYVELDMYVRENQLVMPIAGEVLYQSINGLLPNDDGVNFKTLTVSEVILPREFSGTYDEQETAMGTHAADPATVFDRVNSVPTVMKLNIKALTGGPFQTNYNIPVSMLMIPKTIDLEAGEIS